MPKRGLFVEVEIQPQTPLHAILAAVKCPPLKSLLVFLHLFSKHYPSVTMNALAKKSFKLTKAVYTAVNDAVAHPDQYVAEPYQQYNPQQQPQYAQQHPQQQAHTPYQAQQQGYIYTPSGQTQVGYGLAHGNSPYQTLSPSGPVGSYGTHDYSQSSQHQAPEHQAMNAQHTHSHSQSTGIIGQSSAPPQTTWSHSQQSDQPYLSPLQSPPYNQQVSNPQTYSAPISLPSSASPVIHQLFSSPLSGPSPVNDFNAPFQGYASHISQCPASSQASPALGDFPFTLSHDHSVSPPPHGTSILQTPSCAPGQSSQLPSSPPQQSPQHHIVGFIAELPAEMPEGPVELPTELPESVLAMKPIQSPLLSPTSILPTSQTQGSLSQVTQISSDAPNSSIGPATNGAYAAKSSEHSVASNFARITSGSISAGVERIGSPTMIPPSMITRTPTDQLREPKPLHPPSGAESVTSRMPAMTSSSPSSASPSAGYNPNIFPPMPSACPANASFPAQLLPPNSTSPLQLQYQGTMNPLAQQPYPHFQDQKVQQISYIPVNVNAPGYHPNGPPPPYIR